ncbi:MAG: hypothetical protein E7633_06180 [Ruminococcaceae bacterium]|nr:hypothetical protein [Oscillospiraceae bacterium]
MEFKTKVMSNTHDIELAIKKGMRPMQSFFDTTRDNLPFFGNQMAPLDGFGNFHHPTFSAAHIPGRWLLALLNAESVTGISPDENAVENLRKWAFATLTEVKIGFPACMDHDKGEFIKATDLHNLRETMHALFALYKWRKDEKAKELALGMIRALDRYFDYERGTLNIDKYREETGAEIMYSCSHPSEGLLFPPHFGRYIGPLVKFWKATGESEALAQAIALKDVCFRDILLEDGDYDAVRFGGHTHSTTAMISSLAQLGDVTKDREIFERIDAFFKNGLKKIALPFGWCIEGNHRRDNLIGEINNTSDIMESCLIMGKHGYDGYYAMAEEILRAHFLPAQLLDPCFIPDDENENDLSRHKVASRAKGAFGFPTPYGHEDTPGAWISFNWDIVGGGVNGLCEAYKQLAYAEESMLVIPMHFGCSSALCTVTDPYRANGVMTVTPKQNFSTLKLRIPHRAKIKTANAPYTVCGEWIYASLNAKNEAFTVEFEFETKDITYDFRGWRIKLRWQGEEVIGANNGGRRLCFFESIE